MPLLIGGCALRPDAEVMSYPATWPPLRAAGLNCDDFVGLYRGKGESAQARSNGVNNPTFLSTLGLPGPENTAYVSIQRHSEGNSYTVAALDVLEEPISGVAISEPIACTDGNLGRHFLRAGYADGSTKKSEFVVTLSLTSNGSFVAHSIGNVRTDDLMFRSSHNYDVFDKFARVSNAK